MIFRTCGAVALVLLTAANLSAQERPQVAGEREYIVGGEGNEFTHPVWSPDGSTLAFSRPGYAGIYVIGIDGENLRAVTDEAGAGFGFSWSPDGQEILARVTRADGVRLLHAAVVFDVATSESRQLTDFRHRMPALPRWTPDGAAIVLPLPDAVEVVEHREPTVGLQHTPLFVADDAGIRTVTVRDEAVAVAPILDDVRTLNVAASPDGSRVAFEVIGGDLHAMNADGTGLVSLGRGHRPSWSPDGAWIAFMRTDDDGKEFTSSDLYVARPDGSEIVALTTTPDRMEMNPTWSPDGAAIAFDDLVDGAIYILPMTR